MDDFADLTILVCDDSITNTLVLTKLIEVEIGSTVIPLTDPRKIAPTLSEQPIDLIVLDLEMPHMNGFDVLQFVREEYLPDRLPVLVITGLEGVSARNKALSMAANDFLTKPFDQVEVVLRVKNLLKIRQSFLLHEKDNRLLEKKVQQRTRELNLSVDALLKSLAIAGELKDEATGKHVIRVGKYARILAEGYGLSDELVQMIEQTAPLHDIGKIGIPDHILLKPGRLDLQERKIMNQHALHGRDLIGSQDSSLVQMAQTIAMNHHERWDGNGYPSKLKGESIPIEGRITALADVFDALTTERPYKNAWTFDDAVDYIKDQSGKAFDPALVEIFLSRLTQIQQIKADLAD